MVFEYFMRFDLFQYGIISFFIFFGLIYLITFIFLRAKRNDAREVSFEIVAPALVVSFFMNLFAFNSLLIIIILILIYLICLKIKTDFKYFDWIMLSVCIILSTLIFSILDILLQLIVIGIVILFAFLKSEHELRKKDNDKGIFKKN